jgi:hypothetical protein
MCQKSPNCNIFQQFLKNALRRQIFYFSTFSALLQHDILYKLSPATSTRNLYVSLLIYLVCWQILGIHFHCTTRLPCFKWRVPTIRLYKYKTVQVLPVVPGKDNWISCCSALWYYGSTRPKTKNRDHLCLCKPGAVPVVRVHYLFGEKTVRVCFPIKILGV